MEFILDSKKENEGYTIKPSFDDRFFPDRQADIFVLGKKAGIFGVLNPKINHAFGKLPFPISICEVEIQYIYELIQERKL